MTHLSVLGRGAAAAAIVGIAGGWNGPVPMVLALVSGVTFLDLGRRDLAERDGSALLTRDPFGRVMQLAFLGVLSAAAWDNRCRDPWTIPGLVEGLGLVMLVGGGWLRNSAAQALGRHFTVALSLCDDHELVLVGPYRWLRHPSYTALLLVALGTAAMVRSPLAVVVALVVWLPSALMRIRSEECVLRNRFGEAYSEYSRSSWYLVPWIY
jgi:protein-S-isoprenylcysteine O-methyltransferase Ste14